MKREEITSVIDHTAHENEAIAHLGNTVQSILLMIIQETLKNVMGGGGGVVNLYDQIVYWGHELKHEYKLGFLS
jgi:hypothetical protein